MNVTDIHILVVDDDANLRELLTETLQAIGYQTTSATDGEEALREIRKNSFDLIITDVKMPIMDGISLLNTIKQQQPDLPVLFITGVTEPEAIGQGSPDGFLAKPFRISHIEELIENVISGKTEKVERSIKNVLVVDDNMSFRMYLSDVLSKANYLPTAVGSGRQAMQVLSDSNIDAVITDIKMPEMSGLTLLSLIKDSKPEIPVILMTGYGDIGQTSENSDYNPDGFLKKPCNIKTIIDLLDQLSTNVALSQ